MVIRAQSSMPLHQSVRLVIAVVLHTSLRTAAYDPDLITALPGLPSELEHLKQYVLKGVSAHVSAAEPQGSRGPRLPCGTHFRQI